MEVVADFRADMKQILLRALTASGYEFDPAASFVNVALQYATAEQRFIPVRSRAVHRSTTLVAPAENRTGLRQLLVAVEAGANLRPWQSRGVTDAWSEDALLNDWGVQHFHLGTHAHAKDPSFRARTGPLLFARVEREHFYALAVMTHHSFAERELVNILHRDFPSTIEAHKIRHLDVPPPLTNEEHKGLRTAGVMCAVTVDDGTGYMMIGGGCTSAGTGLSARRRAQDLVHFAARAERWLRDNHEELVERIEHAAFRPSAPVRFRLDSGDNGFWIVEEETRAGCRVPFS